MPNQFGKFRIAQKFNELKAKKSCAFISYLCSGDPDFETALNALKSLPQAGVDIIEIGVPFLDPSGDGPIIEMASKRAIEKGMTLVKTLEMVANFRKNDQKTPIILMSYFNPILRFGIKNFFADALKSGVDGVLIVDLPLEEEQEIAEVSKNSDLAVIRLIAPATDEARMKKIVKNASGFIYLISLMGITGTKLASIEQNQQNLQKLRKLTDLPIAVGFGIKTPQMAGKFAKLGFDGVVIGSSLVEFLAKNNGANLSQFQDLVQEFASKIKDKN